MPFLDFFDSSIPRLYEACRRRLVGLIENRWENALLKCDKPVKPTADATSETAICLSKSICLAFSRRNETRYLWKG